MFRFFVIHKVHDIRLTRVPRLENTYPNLGNNFSKVSRRKGEGSTLLCHSSTVITRSFVREWSVTQVMVLESEVSWVLTLFIYEQEYSFFIILFR